MDSLTHIVLGAAIGEIVLAKKLGKKAMFMGALADTIPDFDMIMNYISSPVDALVIHRGITHSILFALLAPIPLAFLFQKISNKSGTTFKEWFLLFFFGFITHNLLDAMTAYGTGLFEPFSRIRISFNNMFVADPLFTLPYLISFIVLLILKNDSRKRKMINMAAIGISMVYIIVTIGIKTHVNSTVAKSLDKNNISHSRFFTTPTPLNCLLWMAIAESNEYFYIGYYSVFDKNKAVNFEAIPKNHSLVNNVEENELLQTLKYFSDGYYCYTDKYGELYFNDLRFGRISAWGEAQGPFVFQYKLTRGADNSMILEKGRWNSSNSISKEFNLLIQRVKGI